MSDPLLFDLLRKMGKDIETSVRIAKYNHFHDRLGRFASAPGSGGPAISRADDPQYPSSYDGRRSNDESVTWDESSRSYVIDAWTDVAPTGSKIESIHTQSVGARVQYECYDECPQADNPQAVRIWNALPGLSHILLDDAHFDKAAQKEIADAVVKFAKEYPNAASTIKAFRAADAPLSGMIGRGTMGYMESGFTKFKDGSSSVGSAITILPHAVAVARTPSFNNPGMSGAPIIQTVPGLAGRSLAHTVQHEMSHSLNLAYSTTKVANTLEQGGYGSSSPRALAISGHQDMEADAAHYRRAFVGKGGTRAAENVSLYAQTNKTEFFAEANAAVMARSYNRVDKPIATVVKKVAKDWDNVIGAELDAHPDGVGSGILKGKPKPQRGNGTFVVTKRLIFNPRKALTMADAHTVLGGPTDITKYNKNHDRIGRFASNGAAGASIGVSAAKETGSSGAPHSADSKLNEAGQDAEFDKLNGAGQKRYNSAPTDWSHNQAMMYAIHGGSDNGGLHPATAAEKKAMGVAPAYRYVMVADAGMDGNHNGLVARAMAPNGKPQPLYSQAHNNRQAAEKFGRIDETHKAMKKLDANLARDAMKDDTAAAVLVMRKTGMRVDSGDGKGAEKTRSGERVYGAATLQAKHVTVNKDSVRFTFPGKGSHTYDVTVKDADLVKTMTAWKAGKTGNQPLFSTNATKTRDYLKQSLGADAKNHDLRTYKANTIAAKEVASMPKPKTAAEAKKQQNAVGDKVAAVLNDTRSVVLKNYINPAVFNDWSV